jgi:flagellin
MSVLTLQSNVSSQRAQRHVQTTQFGLNRSLQRLSSGFRINSARDDAAGLGVSERLRAQVRGMSMAARNAQDGYNIVQSAEGSLSEITAILQRMRELSVQAASDNLTTVEQGYLDKEFQALLAEVGRLSKATKYNGQQLINGSFTGKVIQVGADSGADFRISITIVGATVTTLGMSGQNVTSTVASNTAITKLDAALDNVNGQRAKLGALMSNLSTARDHVRVMREALAASESQIRDADVAVETSSFARSQVLMQAGVAMLAQANAQPQLALRLLG